MKKDREMKKERDPQYVISGSYGGWLDVRTLLGTVLFMGFVFLLTQSMLRILKAPCLATTPSAPAIPSAMALIKEETLIVPKESESKPSESKVFESKVVKSEVLDSKGLEEGLENSNGSAEGRKFQPYGSGAYLFIEFGTYRGGPESFAVVGLASKPIHVYGKPTFECEWIPNESNSSITPIPVIGNATKMLPDWGYGRVYTVVVVNCTFPHPVGVDGKGGQLVLHASPGKGNYGQNESFVSLQESPGEYRAEAFPPNPKYRPTYDFVYCGSPLYGTLNSYRLREWVAYHARLFGPRSLLVLYDAGGIDETVLNHLRPWIESGFLLVENVRQQERFDGYYYNQFLIVNDCLHKYRFLARWAFFFDVDEFLYIPPKETLNNVMNELSNYTQITYEQVPIADRLCLAKDKSKSRRQWGFEKLVFKNVKRNFRWDRKYVIQPWAAIATGVHMSENIVGPTLHSFYPKLKYYHYHNTINNLRDVCKVYVSLNSTKDTFYFEKEPYRLDLGMQALALDVKRFEVRHLRRTGFLPNSTTTTTSTTNSTSS